MPKIRSYATAINYQAVETTSHTGTLPKFVAGDLLIWIVAKDNHSGGSFSTPSGWSRHTSMSTSLETASCNVIGALYYKVAGSTETPPTTTNADVDAFCSIMLAIEGVDTTQGSGGITGAEFSAHSTSLTNVTTPDITSWDANDLFLYFIVSAEDAVSTTKYNFLTQVEDNAKTCAIACGYYGAERAGTGVIAGLTGYFVTAATTAKTLSLRIADNGDGKLPAFSLGGTKFMHNTDEVVDGTTRTINTAAVFGASGNGFYGFDCRYPDHIYDYNSNTTTYTDITGYLHNFNVTNQYGWSCAWADSGLYIGDAAPFDSFHPVNGTVTGAGGACAWEYWNGSSWTAITLIEQSDRYKNWDNSTARGPVSFIFDGGAPGDWATTTVNGTNAYWLRIRVTTPYTTAPYLCCVRINGRPFYQLRAAYSFEQGPDSHVPTFTMPGTGALDVPPYCWNVISELYLAPTRNFNFLAGGMLSFFFRTGNKRDTYELSPALASPTDAVEGGGIWFGIGDVNGRVKVWQISASDAYYKSEEWNIAVIDVASTDSLYYGNDAANFSLSSVRFLWLGATPSINSTATVTAGAFYTHGDASPTVIHTLSGGSSSVPVTFNDIITALNNGDMLSVIRRGFNSITAYCSLNFGCAGWSGPVYDFYMDLKYCFIQFPSPYNFINKNLNAHYGNKRFKVNYQTFYSYCQLFHTYSTIYADSHCWDWFFDDSNYPVANRYDFTELKLFKAYNVTLTNTYFIFTFKKMYFIDCLNIYADSAYLEECTLEQFSPGQNNRLITNTTTNITKSDISVDTLDAGEYLCSTSDPTIFSYCTFNGSSSGGHAIRITAPGTYNFSGNIFSNFGADGTTSAAIFNDSGGSVTLNIINGGNTPTYRNGTSATTTINNAVLIHVHCINESGSNVENARVRLVKTTGGAVVLEGLTNASGYIETSYDYSSDEAVEGWARKSTSSPLYKQADIVGTITSNGFDTTVILVLDE